MLLATSERYFTQNSSKLEQRYIKRIVHFSSHNVVPISQLSKARCCTCTWHLVSATLVVPIRILRKTSPTSTEKSGYQPLAWP